MTSAKLPVEELAELRRQDIAHHLPGQTTFAMGESVAHLHLLWFDGRVRRTLDADGIYRFQAVAPA